MKIEELKSAGILGLGKMGSAIAGGLQRAYPDLTLYCYDPVFAYSKPDVDSEKMKAVQALVSAEELEKNSDLLILAVKPQDMADAIKNLSGEKKYISVAAGLTTAQIRTMMNSPDSKHIARVMPNLSALIGQGVAGVYAEDVNLLHLATGVFSTLGLAIPVEKEEKLHAITGLAGSGPAYVFAFIQALAEGGVQQGLGYDESLKIAAATVKGAASLLLETREHPSVWRNRVTSPAGTTITGLEALERGAFHATVMNAVTAATGRSRGLGSSSTNGS